MADQKKWFKVWTSLLVDYDHLSDIDIGKWVRLGCRIALVGNNGKVSFEGGFEHLAAFLKCPVDEVKLFAKRVKGITCEEGKTVHGEIIVSMTKWYEYQCDSTYKERLKKTRDKRRGEEKRGEETRTEENTPLVLPPKCDPEWIESLKTNPAYKDIDLNLCFAKMKTWCDVNHKIPSRRRFINWINRQDKPMQTAQIKKPHNPNDPSTWVKPDWMKPGQTMKMDPEEAKAKYGHLES